jgi:tellurite resistance protein TerC
MSKNLAIEFSLIAILSFVGLKMLLHEIIEIPEWASLAFIALSPRRNLSIIANEPTRRCKKDS